jgi:osmotically-inducible protein OsmY
LKNQRNLEAKSCKLSRFLLAFTLVGGAAAWAAASDQTHAASADAQHVEADNSKVNQRDRAFDAVTPDQQSNNTSDLEVTKNIRQAVVAEKSLSTYFHNIKIITQNGEVTLKGPVRTEAEKMQAEKLARATNGVSRVNNLLSVQR